jgi:hypothetical protein
MMYEPFGTLPAVNVNASRSPVAVKVHVVGLKITVVDVGLEIPKSGGDWQLVIGPASVEAKPLPETVTTVPAGPDPGLSLIVGGGPVSN